MVENEGKGRKMTGFQRHKKIVVLIDILKPSQTSMAEKKRALTTMVTAIYDNYDNVSQKAEDGF